MNARKSEGSKSVYIDVEPATRSRMQAVRRANTAPEMLVRRLLHQMGYRFRLHRKDLPGSPDIVLPKYHKVIFVHGCFWHGHQGCRRAKIPSKNNQAWQEKITCNQARDARNSQELIRLGWGVLVLWECELTNLSQTATRLQSFLSIDKVCDTLGLTC